MKIEKVRKQIFDSFEQYQDLRIFLWNLQIFQWRSLNFLRVNIGYFVCISIQDSAYRISTTWIAIQKQRNALVHKRNKSFLDVGEGAANSFQNSANQVCCGYYFLEYLRIYEFLNAVIC